jgi:hypothetical protein
VAKRLRPAAPQRCNADIRSNQRPAQALIALAAMNLIMPSAFGQAEAARFNASSASLHHQAAAA